MNSLFVTDLYSVSEACPISLKKALCYLWCKIEPQIAVVAQCILNEKWHFVTQAELHLSA